MIWIRPPAVPPQTVEELRQHLFATERIFEGDRVNTVSLNLNRDQLFLRYFRPPPLDHVTYYDRDLLEAGHHAAHQRAVLPPPPGVPPQAYLVDRIADEFVSMRRTMFRGLPNLVLPRRRLRNELYDVFRILPAAAAAQRPSDDGLTELLDARLVRAHILPAGLAGEVHYILNPMTPAELLQLGLERVSLEARRPMPFVELFGVIYAGICAAVRTFPTYSMRRWEEALMSLRDPRDHSPAFYPTEGNREIASRRAWVPANPAPPPLPLYDEIFIDAHEAEQLRAEPDDEAHTLIYRNVARRTLARAWQEPDGDANRMRGVRAAPMTDEEAGVQRMDEAAALRLLR